MAILLYGSKTWTLTKASSSSLQAFHMRSQRQLMCVRWDDFVTNVHISSVTVLDNICSIIHLRCLSLLCHVSRLDRTVPAWKALNLALKIKSGFFPNPGWLCPQGCRRRTWMDHVKEDTAAPLDSLMCLVADKQAWRRLRYGPRPTLGWWWYLYHPKFLYQFLCYIAYCW